MAGPGPSLADLSGPNAAQVLARLRASGPVEWVPSLSAWLVTSHELAVRVLRDDERFTVDDPRFSTAQLVGPSMLSLDGDRHRVHRNAFAAPFRPRRISERFHAEVSGLVAGLVGEFRHRGAADLRTELAGPLSVAVVASALGLRDVDATTVLGWYREIVAAVTALSGGGAVDPAADAAMRSLDAHVRSGLSSSSLLNEAVGTLTEAEVVSNAAVMMFGGIETTEGMICTALLYLLTNPDAVSAVRGDPALVDTAIEESLRLEPAAAVLDRYATTDLSIGDASIQRGALVRVSIMAANRDPAVFPSPDTYDLTRPNLRSQLAFAQGPHICIAADLARLETRAAIHAVLELPGIRVDEPVAPTGLVFRKPAALRASWDSPAPSAG